MKNPNKQLAIQRTVIPISYDRQDPNGFNKWQDHIRFENYLAMGLPLMLPVQERLMLVKSDRYGG